MKILTRYILREHAGPMIAALGVLVGLMLLNQLGKRLGDLVGKGLPWYMIAEVFGLSIPFILAMTMPMAVLVAVLYTFNRLGSDNEITAIRAGGVSLVRLMLPVLAAATLIAGGMIWFNDTILPESNHALRRLLTDIGRKRPTFELRERVVNEVVPGKLFLQAARIDRGRSVLRDMVIFDVSRSTIQRTIYADSGHMAFNEAQTDLYLMLYDGSMHETDRNSLELDQRSHYREQVIRVSGVSNELERGQATDWRGDREMNIAMMSEEVNARQTRMRQLEDSVLLFISTMALQPDSSPAPGPEPGLSTSSAASATAAAARSQEPSPVQSLRRIISPSRRAPWPPMGRPGAYANRIRNEFKRYDNQLDLNRREMNRYSVEIHKKFAIPVAAIVFVLIGAPVGALFRRGGVGMVIGVSLGVFCVYYVFLIGGEDLADRSIVAPFWAMWGPNVIFALLGCAILYYAGWGRLRMRRLPFPLRNSALTLGLPRRPKRQPAAD